MKNIAIPLLMAGSAKAEAKKKAADMDYAVPEPILIASTWTADVCVDAAGDVAAALLALEEAEAAHAEIEEGYEELDEAFTDALEARVDAVAAVIEEDEDMATAVETNNANITALLGLAEALNVADVAAALGAQAEATALQAESDTSGTYDASLIVYEGDSSLTVPTTGLLGAYNDVNGDLGDAQDTETDAGGTLVGSTAWRNAQQSDYAQKNCNSVISANVSTLGDAAYDIWCSGASMTSGYSAYTTSLSSLKSSMDGDLTTKGTAADTQAAALLLKTEYEQTKIYLAVSVDNATKNAKILSTVSARTAGDREDQYYDAEMSEYYLSGNPTIQNNDILTAAELEQKFISGNSDLGTSQSAIGVRTPRGQEWVVQLELVYGDLGTSGGVASGDGSTPSGTSSAEYTLAQNTASGTWVTNAGTYIAAAKKYLDAAAEDQCGTDGFTSAFTELKWTDTTDSSTYNAQCAAAAGGNAVASSTASALTGTEANAWATTTADTTNTLALSAATDTTSTHSHCAQTCMVKVGTSTNSYGGTADTSQGAWIFDATPNLPQTVAKDASKTPADCYTYDNSGTYECMDANWCLGFESKWNNTPAHACAIYYGGFPAAESTGSSPSAGQEEYWCYRRNFSYEAQEFASKVTTPGVDVATSVGGTNQWDDLLGAVTTWAGVYDDLIDKKANLDIATYYYTQLNTVYTDAAATPIDGTNGYDAGAVLTPIGRSIATGFLEQYTWTDSGSAVTIGTAIANQEYGHLYIYNEAVSAYNTAADDYTDSETAYNTRSVVIDLAYANYQEAEAAWAENNALISKLTILTAIANEDQLDAAAEKNTDLDAFEAAQDDYDDAVDDMTNITTGFTALETAAELAYDDAEDDIYGTAGTDVALGTFVAGGTGALGALYDLRATAGVAYDDLQEAIEDLTTLEGDISDAEGTVEDKLADHLAAIVACKEENYDAYLTTLQLAVAQRITDLADIATLISTAEEALPAAGAAGSRCEKAMSNGTFRPVRGEGTCNEGLCCGAARIADGDVTMTIETCQAEGTSTYSYQPPRAPMATEMPTKVSYDFVCIEGAKKLAAAASALATAVYMLA